VRREPVDRALDMALPADPDPVDVASVATRDTRTLRAPEFLDSWASVTSVCSTRVVGKADVNHAGLELLRPAPPDVSPEIYIEGGVP
jgi:hypothetical protein